VFSLLAFGVDGDLGKETGATEVEVGVEETPVEVIDQ
jgi:hypothetical protein